MKCQRTYLLKGQYKICIEVCKQKYNYKKYNRSGTNLAWIIF